ncbi:type IV secretory pathway VirD2 relaxase [Bradyrhizobium sp. USDA 4524]|uniref:hypothetical protein n=1 Tax=unclassified Bradyrhizobium TaxID=2631580 RepID=UPI00209DB1F0|nr:MULTISPECIES: hypothetical protein [unclassified Bradyrhizobium]MCP1843943.1 type IV secretory pathway VirD2 relaxase [Bradyrhizobium sp. USDA 4538]MCP1904509.1 type IV secretory pathway VirD2 relaxase [Bradyrhizobium sp. USDA 4537]MCP1989835.1 type IV secretory pathway VirD2 relaxase [Bradyrhizobium sp. USDA 4539]
MERDGVKRESEPGELYDAARDRADGKAFTERSAGDNQFRFIVAPEDNAELSDLQPFILDQKRLGVRLAWVAGDRFNTGHPHSHVVLRSRNVVWHDLVIARDYIAHD